MLVDIFKGPYEVCLANFLPRGSIGAGDREGWVVASCQIENKQGIGTMTIRWDAGGPDGYMPEPCDEFELMPEELYPKTEKSPIFNAITFPVMQLVMDAIHNPNITTRKAAYQSIVTHSPTTEYDQATVLVDLLTRGVETYYVAGLRYTFSRYSYIPPVISLGGFIEYPDGPLSGLLPTTYGWLRLADRLEAAGVNGSMFKKTKTWLGCPAGHWDEALYPAP
jgi:hypothetical protein